MNEKTVSIDTSAKNNTIPGTKFVCDFFKTGPHRQTAKAFFLSHFHADHYGSLPKVNWSTPIYCSEFTKDMLINIYGFKKTELIHVIQNYEITNIDGVDVMAIPAHHCPGSIMFLFTVKKKRILFTGDFRLDINDKRRARVLEYGFNHIFFDATYKQHDFLPRQLLITRFLNFFSELRQQDVRVAIKTYTIGKELLIFALVALFRWNVWAPPKRMYSLQHPLLVNKCANRLKLFGLVTDEQVQYLMSREYFVEDPSHAKILVTFPKRLAETTFEVDGNKIIELKQNESICYVEATGWVHKQGVDWQPEVINTGKYTGLIKVPYSEHNSGPELSEFLKKNNKSALTDFMAKSSTTEKCLKYIKY